MTKPSPAWNFCSGAFFPRLSWMKPPFTPIWTWDRETTPIQQVRLDIRGPWDAATDVEGLDKASLTEGVDIAMLGVASHERNQVCVKDTHKEDPSYDRRNS